AEGLDLALLRAELRRLLSTVQSAEVAEEDQHRGPVAERAAQREGISLRIQHRVVEEHDHKMPASRRGFIGHSAESRKPKRTKAARRGGLRDSTDSRRLRFADVLRLQSLGALGHVEFHAVTFGQRAEPL